jgi:phytoene dehydrogenase-like protein
VIPISYADPTTVPEGQGLAYMYLPIYPVELNSGWGNQKAAAAEAIVARASEYYTGFEAELGRWFETCPDREARAGVPHGITSQVDFSAFRMGAQRPAFGLGGPHGLAPGLFIGGAASHPGAGVSGNAGRLAARRVSAYLAR